MAQRIAFTTMMPPSLNNLFTNRPGKGRVPSKRYATWLRVAETDIMVQRASWNVKTISGPVEIDIRLGKPDNRRRDLDNFSKGLLDAAVRMGLIDDDSHVHRLTIAWADVDGAHVEIVPHVIYPKGEEPRMAEAAE